MVAMVGNQWGSRIGEQLLRKLSSSLSHATLDVSLTALLGTIIHENASDVLQKINKLMKCILFRHPESGVENSVLIHRRTEKYEMGWFC